jgi:hypothetical protein
MLKVDSQEHVVLCVNCRLISRNLNNLTIYLLVKLPNIKFYGMFRDSLVVKCGKKDEQREGQTNIEKLIGVFFNSSL